MNSFFNKLEEFASKHVMGMLWSLFGSGVLLIVLKLLAVISWSWWFVCTPMIIFAILALLIIGGILMITSFMKAFLG